MSLRAAFVTICLLLTPQVGQANGEGTGLLFADTCIGSTDLAAIEATLADKGWSVATAESDALIDGLAWIGTSQYFTTDSGGELVETILALKTKAAHGLLRKVDIPQSKNRYFTRNTEAGAEVLHVMWRQPVPTTIEVECRAALSTPLLTNAATPFGKPNFPAFAQFTLREAENENATLIHLSPNALAPLKPPKAIVTTYKTEKVTP